MKIVIENRKTRYLLKKEGLYYALLTNTPSAKNEPKLLHEYGFSPDQVVGRQQVLWQKKVEVNFDFAYKLVEKSTNGPSLRPNCSWRWKISTVR